MKTLSLAALQRDIQARKMALGLQEAPADTDALRNKGAMRTPEKRELLKRIGERAQAAGLPPIVSYY